MTDAPETGATSVAFTVPDPGRALRDVRLHQEVTMPRTGPRFAFGDGVWTLRLARPPADRLEYLIETVAADGTRTIGPDPSNPLRARGPFGEKSVVEWPEYRPPQWLDADVPAGERNATLVASRILKAELAVVLWSAAGAAAGAPLPLLVVHDGPEYDDYSSLTRMLDVIASDGLAFRAALVAPVDRNQTYSASAAYARAFAAEILPALLRVTPAPPGPRAIAGLGASLGALALLHLHLRHPGIFGGLLLQSGSFFRRALDPQERGFPRFERIARFVSGIERSEESAAPIPVTLTSGLAEENLRNNRALAETLRRRGFPVIHHQTRDAHNWVSWRDAWDPALANFLRTLWQGS